MTDEPLDITRYIFLKTENALSSDVVKDFYRIVGKLGPSGIRTAISTIDADGMPHGISLVHREVDGANSYLIPITRDLSDREVKAIADQIAADYPELDFDLGTNATTLISAEADPIAVDKGVHDALCGALAKQQHAEWVKERTEAGWRYGTTVNTNDKTHPLLRPWEDLPEQFRKPNTSWPQKVIDLLSQQGYAVVKKEELESLVRTLKGLS